MERPHRLGPPYADPRRHDDPGGALRQAPEQDEGGLPRRCAEQHVLRLDDGRGQDGHALRGPGAPGAGPADGPGAGEAGLRRGQAKRRPH